MRNAGRVRIVENLTGFALTHYKITVQYSKNLKIFHALIKVVNILHIFVTKAPTS